MANMNDDELLDALGVEVESLETSSRSSVEERMVAGFEDILRFYQAHGRAPVHGEGRDFFERLYAVRLDQLRNSPVARAVLSGLDSANLLTSPVTSPISVDELDEDTLLAELGIGENQSTENDITILRHVRSSIEKRAAEEIGNRTPCNDYEVFKPLFEKVKIELKSGARETRSFKVRALDEIQKGTFFIIGGQIAYVAEVGEEFTTQYERRDSRLRVIYDNETESDVLQRSLQRALHRDDSSRLITDPNAGPLFGQSVEEDDIASGTIYVLRSLSNHPFILKHRELIHKIGVTGSTVESRIAGANKDATYLLADVEVVATYGLHNISRMRLENLFHKLFSAAQIDLTIEDRFGNPVKPKEWFLVPLSIIDEAVHRIQDGSIVDFVYDPKTARLVG